MVIEVQRPIDLNRDHLFALLEACLVTLLWSSSYVFVKIGLTHISPLTLVSLRYVIASAVLILLVLLGGKAQHLKDRKTILKLFFLGFLGYTIAQGLQCVGLYYLSATSVTFILNFTPIIVLILGVMFLREYPTLIQIVGMIFVMVGAYLFFNDPLANISLTGVLITMFSGLGWAAYLVFSRRLFIKDKTEPLELTAFSMSFGTLLMTIGAYSFEGFPFVSRSGWGIIIWLGITNTALAFFMWNHALRRLEAFEISILQNTMLIQIALLSWFFLGEQITGIKVISMVIVFAGVLVVQVRKKQS